MPNVRYTVPLPGPFNVSGNVAPVKAASSAVHIGATLAAAPVRSAAEFSGDAVGAAVVILLAIASVLAVPSFLLLGVLGLLIPLGVFGLGSGIAVLIQFAD
jgi:hypothetical protein